MVSLRDASPGNSHLVLGGAFPERGVDFVWGRGPLWEPFGHFLIGMVLLSGGEGGGPLFLSQRRG